MDRSKASSGKQEGGVHAEMTRPQPVGEPPAGAVVPTGEVAGSMGRGGDAGRILERQADNVSDVYKPTRIIVGLCGCRRRMCPVCGRRVGNQTRDALLQKAGVFLRPAMLTLTTHRDKGPAEMYEAVRRGRFVSRLMAHFGLTRWVWVLEFQRDGYAHWHVLFDRAECVNGFIDYNAIRELWGKRWGLGEQVRVSDGPQGGGGFNGARHAIMYITKYLTKQPEHGYPPWVLERRVCGHKNSIRWLGAGAAIGPIFEHSRGAASDEPDEVETGEVGLDEAASVEVQAEWPRYADILARCGSTSRVFAVDVNGWGVERRRYLGTLPVSNGQLVAPWRSDLDDVLDRFWAERFGGEVPEVFRVVRDEERQPWGGVRHVCEVQADLWVGRYVRELAEVLERAGVRGERVPVEACTGVGTFATWPSAEALIQAAQRELAAYLTERTTVGSATAGALPAVPTLSVSADGRVGATAGGSRPVSGGAV